MEEGIKKTQKQTNKQKTSKDGKVKEEGRNKWREEDQNTEGKQELNDGHKRTERTENDNSKRKLVISV